MVQRSRRQHAVHHSALTCGAVDIGPTFSSERPPERTVEGRLSAGSSRQMPAFAATLGRSAFFEWLEFMYAFGPTRRRRRPPTGARRSRNARLSKPWTRTSSIASSSVCRAVPRITHQNYPSRRAPSATNRTERVRGASAEVPGTWYSAAGNPRPFAARWRNSSRWSLIPSPGPPKTFAVSRNELRIGSTSAPPSKWRQHRGRPAAPAAAQRSSRAGRA